MSHFSSRTLIDAFIPRSTFYDSPFGRMFGKLMPWIPEGNTDTQREAQIKTFANTLFEPDPLPDPDPFDNERIPAGYTYFGQFVDHDITLDTVSSLARQNDPNRLRNFRTPRLDLDSVYGGGPAVTPYLYDQRASHTQSGFSGFFLIGKGKTVGGEQVTADLPRNTQDTALIGDPRNDENVIVGQLQLCFLRFHNRVLTAIAGGTKATPEQFEQAQKLVRWTYQYIVWNDFARRLLPDDLHDDILKAENGLLRYHGRFYRWKQAPYIPVEFSVAAYRFGHSMVRPGYQTNNPFLGFGVERPIFVKSGSGPDLRGGRKLEKAHVVQWDWFLKLPSSAGPFPQASRRIDTKLSSSVFRIPGPGGGNPLARLNLLRGWRMELPGGTSIANAMGIPPLTLANNNEDALWHYILLEAEKLPGINAGTMLGRVGATIVGEVLAGLISGDPLSYANCEPAWSPTEVDDLLGGTGPIDGDWELADLIRFGEMPEDNQGVTDFVS